MNRSPLWQNITGKMKRSQDETLDFLKNTPVFGDLSIRELRMIRSLCHIRHYKKDEHIFRGGEPGVGMYIIIEGSVEIYQEGDDFYREFAVLYGGEFFGEIALLDDLLRTASARARSYSTLLGFYRPDLLSILNRNPSLAGQILLNIARLIGERLVNTNTELERMHLKLADMEKERHKHRSILARPAVKKRSS